MDLKWKIIGSDNLIREAVKVLIRIGATITHLTGSTILGRDTQNKGNRFFQIQTHIAAPQRAILVDASGLFGGATPPFQGNDPFIIPDIVTLNLAPLINGASYHCVCHASGTAADQQDLELISTTKEQFGVPSIAPYGANGDIVTSVVTYKMEMGGQVMESKSEMTRVKEMTEKN